MSYDGRFPEPPYETEMDKDERIAELEQKCAELEAENARLMEELNKASQSDYAACYHAACMQLRCDDAVWSDLEEGGRFEEWLAPFNQAEQALKEIEGRVMRTKRT